MLNIDTNVCYNKINRGTGIGIIMLPAKQSVTESVTTDQKMARSEKCKTYSAFGIENHEEKKSLPSDLDCKLIRA